LRRVRGIEVDDDTLSLAAMREVCLGGPGHYLGHGSTLSRMQTDYIYPALGDRTSPKEWVEKDRPDLIAKATARKHEILGTASRAAFDPATDRAIRDAFRIHLPG
jgi:trimethylamine--corrinoid protein Co-methyltransferase